MCRLQKPNTMLPSSSIPHSQLPAALQQAYHASLYRVDTAEGDSQTLRVGERNHWLEQQLQRLPVKAACYLTACNPRGQVLSDTDNAKRMTALRQALQSEGWSYLNGCGQDPQGLWPGEDSVLIWGMDVDTARQWGQQWEQNALLWMGADGLPRLLWLR